MNGEVGGNLCPLDSKLESYEHVFRQCFFGAFMADKARLAFGVVVVEGGHLEPS